MRLTPARKLFIALALLLGQWLLAAHTFEHPALAADQDCHICSVAQALGSAPPPAAPLLLVAGVHEAPQVLPQAAPALVSVAHYRIRGPPALTA